MSSALAHPAFRIVWIGSIFSYTAQWVQQVSIGWVGYEVTGSAAMLGLILGMRALPMLLFAPFSGVAADRYDRRKLLIASQSLYAIAAFAITGVILAQALQAWHLFVLVFVIGLVGVFDRNLRQAIALDLVPREAAVSAVALNNVSSSGARVFAPAAAGALLAALGSAGNFLLQGIIYAAVAASLFWVHGPRRIPPAAGVSAWASLSEGLSFTTRDPVIRVLALSGVIPFLFLIPAWGTLLPVLARDVFAAGPQSLGWLFSAVGLGGFLGGVAGAYVGRYDRLGLISLGSLALFAVSLLAIGLAPTLEAALPFVVLAGLGEMLNITANQTLVQMVAPEAMRGRVTSLLAVFPAFISLGSIPVGLGAEWLGARDIILVIAVAGGLACAAFWIFSPLLRGLRLSHYR